MKKRSTEPFWGSKVWLWCGLAAVVVRVVWLRSVQHETFFFAHVQDAALYHEMAQKILADGLPMAEAFSVAPLYAFFLAAVYAVAGIDPTWVYIVQIVMAFFTVSITAGLGRKLFGGVGAWCGGLVAALYPIGIIYDVRLLSVGLGTLMTVSAAAMAHRAWTRGLASGWLWAGLVLGVGVLVRGNLLLVAPGLVAVAFWRGRFGHAAACALGVGLAIAPATAHNFMASGEWIPVSLGGGINLYRGNNPYFKDAAVHPFRLPPQRDGLLRQAQLIASIQTDQVLSAGESDRYWTALTLAYIRSEPMRTIGISLRKLTQVLSPVEIGDHLDLKETVRSSAVLKYIPPVYLPVMLLGVLGLVVTRREEDAGPSVILVLGMASISAFFVVSRYRAPLVPLMAIYAGGGAQWLWAQSRARRKRSLGLAFAGMAALAVSVTLPTLHQKLPWNILAGPAREADACGVDSHTRHAAAVEEAFNVGVFALNHGRLADAEAAMWSVLKADKFHTPAGVNLSWLLLRKGANKEAAGIAKKVLEGDPCDDKALANLATAQLRNNQANAALTTSKRAVEINPYNPGYWSIVGESMLALGNRDGAKVYFGRAVKWRPDLWQSHARLGQMALEEGRFEEASASLQRAVQAQPTRVELIGMLGLSEVGRGNRLGAKKLLSAAVKSGLRGPALTALAKALAAPEGG